MLGTPHACLVLHVRQAGCIIGVDYPKPVLKHEDVVKLNMTKMKAAFDANKAAKAGNAGDAGAAKSKPKQQKNKQPSGAPVKKKLKQTTLV